MTFFQATIGNDSVTIGDPNAQEIAIRLQSIELNSLVVRQKEVNAMSTMVGMFGGGGY
jgi:hypothetical protein